MPAEPLLTPAVDSSGPPPLHILAADQTKRCAACQRPLASSSLASADQLSQQQQQQQDVSDTSGASFCVACREARLVRYSPIDDSLQQQQQQQQQRTPVRSIRRRTGSITTGSTPSLAIEALQMQQQQHHLTTQMQIQSPSTPTPTTPRAGELDGDVDGAHRRERERERERHARPFTLAMGGGALTRPDPLIPHRTLPLPIRTQLQRTQPQPQLISESSSNTNTSSLSSEKERERDSSPARPSPSTSTPPSSLTSSFSFSSTSGSAVPSTHSLPAHSESRSPQRHGSKDSRGNQRARHSDPLVDITRLRVRSRGYKCLYPGATFKGWQKSGRNSYEVTVTIIDIDFPSSYACGYLRICGLTDDWPELTTYFDAQIIGPRHGFDTQQSENWGAQRSDDLVHWGRFPVFHELKEQGLLREPRLTIPAEATAGQGGPGSGAVFMRWKERFLVPDHRVQDLTGASFSGFYYVCVDFEPQRRNQSVIPPPTVSGLSSAPSSHSYTASSVTNNINNTSGSYPAYQYSTNPSNVQRVLPSQNASYSFNPTFTSNSTYYATSSSSSTPTPAVPAAAPEVVAVEREDRRDGEWDHDAEESVPTMCGFYHHQNSEPYQQLSLKYVNDRFRSSFEFR